MTVGLTLTSNVAALPPHLRRNGGCPPSQALGKKQEGNMASWYRSRQRYGIALVCIVIGMWVPFRSCGWRSSTPPTCSSHPPPLPPVYISLVENSSVGHVRSPRLSLVGREGSSEVAMSGWDVPPAILPNLVYCDDPACTGVQQVVSISLYGSNPRYTVGAIHNSELARDVFPEWSLRVYIPEATSPDQVVPDDVKAALTANGAIIQVVDAKTVAEVGFGMNQRFLIAGDTTVDRFIVRDSDSRCVVAVT